MTSDNKISYLQNAVVYCIDGSKNYLEMVKFSITGIRHFNKKIQIIILATALINDKDFEKLNVRIIKFKPIFKKFPSDKCIVGQIDARNILLLDVDTFILGDIESIFNISKSDISARWSYRYSEIWEEKYDKIWKSNNVKLGIKKADILNTGVVVFRNFAHKKLFNVWVNTIKKFYKKELEEVYGGEWMFEQLSLSMSIFKLGLDVNILDKKFHIFGWNPEELKIKDPLIIHTNSSKYYELKKLLRQ